MRLMIRHSTSPQEIQPMIEVRVDLGALEPFALVFWVEEETVNVIADFSWEGKEVEFGVGGGVGTWQLNARLRCGLGAQ